MPAEPILPPIVYVRGYAGSQGAVEETVATPYMGFNTGSTKARQTWTGDIVKHVFESPLVRLMKDFGYRDVYSNGAVRLKGSDAMERPVVIHRYYDEVSEDLGTGERPEIEHYARGLDALITELRAAWCEHHELPESAFRVHLVAHSMGGLICRAFLQNIALSSAENRAAVAKLFTYATPHGGIDVRVLGNLPGFLTRNNMDNFNHGRMREFLALPPGTDVRSLNGAIDPERVFCLVGTNARDYEVAAGWSSRAVGELSDGLVRIVNASVQGAPRAFVHRAHSGHYGIVNSEEGYQNLVRFLFGDVRVDGVLEVAELELPTKVRKAYEAGKPIKASYHFETVVRTRGATTVLHSRTVAENCAIFRKFDEMLRPEGGASPRMPHLFSTFLDSRWRSDGRSGPLVFAVDVVVRVPRYEVDGFLWMDAHIEGSVLHRETIVLAAVPPAEVGEEWSIRHGSNPLSTRPTPRDAERVPDADRTEREAADGALVFRVPIDPQQRPGVRGALRVAVRPCG